jgi:bifunctional UDP-N-acetylglucosamine pyrophosphorylase / glucosamine-1-phosphate N-acetyltransferase
MVERVLDACEQAGVTRLIAVLSPAQPEVAGRLEGRCEVVFQAERHRETGAAATLATVRDPGRPDGRVIRSADGSFRKIVEHRDATAEERACDEINVGLYCFRGSDLSLALSRISSDNAQGEYYLTDVFNHLRPVEVVTIEDRSEALGINDRVQLSQAEAALRGRVLERLMRGGVTVVDPATTYVEPQVRVGADTVLEPMTVLRGETVVGEACRIGPGADIADSVIGDGVTVTHSHLRGARMAEGSDCGPFAKLRPGADIGPGVHIGSFGEVVRSRLGRGTKMGHFSYLGDATVGEDVNIGAGAISANFDGRQKHPTVIGRGAFIGCDSVLIAPVTIGEDAATGAGAIVNHDVPPGSLAVGMPARPIRRRRAETPAD